MTFFFAIWGAVLGTLTFAWNVWKWRHESPHIVETVKAVRSIWDEKEFAGIRLILRNRGGAKTTVEGIFLSRSPQWREFGVYCILFRLRRRTVWQQNVAISNPNTVKLPVVLGVNEVWEGFMPLELNDPGDEKQVGQIQINRETLNVLKSRNLRYSIQCSHTSRRIRGFVGIEDDAIKE